MFKLERLVQGNWKVISKHASKTLASAAYCVACGTVAEYKPYYWGLDLEGKRVIIPTNDPAGRLDLDIRIVCPAQANHHNL